MLIQTQRSGVARALLKPGVQRAAEPNQHRQRSSDNQLQLQRAARAPHLDEGQHAQRVNQRQRQQKQRARQGAIKTQPKTRATGGSGQAIQSGLVRQGRALQIGEEAESVALERGSPSAFRQ